MRIRTLLTAGTVALILLTIVTGATLFQTYRQISDARAVDRLTGEVVKGLFQHQSLASEYLLLGTSRPRRQWEMRSNSLLDLVDRLPAAILKGGTETDLLRRDIELLGIVFLQLFAAEQTDFGTNPELAVQWRSRLAADFRRISQTAVTTATRIAEEAREVEMAAERRAILLLAVFVASTVALVLSIWFVVSNRVLRRLNLLRGAIRSLERGDLSHRLGLASRDEFGDVAGSFDRMADELERSHKELEQFAYVASHDLQEPLRMVASYTELLAKRYGDQLDEKADKYIGYAVDGAKRMQALINDLLAFSRVGTRGKSLEPTPCEAVVSEAADNLRAAIDDSGASISHGPLPVVRADRVQLVQVFQNLIANAIRYRRTEPPRIKIAAVSNGAAWTFSVSDNGIGVDPQFAERIFVIFQRLHERSTTDGNGIGLAVVKKVIERHGGRIWLDDRPNQVGSTFLFTLPAI